MATFELENGRWDSPKRGAAAVKAGKSIAKRHGQPVRVWEMGSCTSIAADGQVVAHFSPVPWEQLKQPAGERIIVEA